MGSKWVITGGAAPEKKRKTTSAKKSGRSEKKFKLVSITRADGTRMTADQTRQQRLEADLRKSRDEVGRERGGGVGAVLFDLGDGRERRLDGFEAGDTLAKGEDEGESYGRSIFGQKPTKTTRDLGYERRR